MDIFAISLKTGSNTAVRIMLNTKAMAAINRDSQKNLADQLPTERAYRLADPHFFGPLFLNGQCSGS